MEDAEPQGGTAPDLKADVQIEATFCGTAWFAATSFREITWYGSGFGYRLKLIASARASLPTKVDGDDLVKYLFFGN